MYAPICVALANSFRVQAFKIQILNAVSERYSNDKRHVYYNGDPVTAENWRELDLVEKAKKGDVILVLKYQDQPEDCYYHSPESSESTSERYF